MNKCIIIFLTITLVNLSNLSAYQEIYMESIDDGPETSSTSYVVSPVTDITISVDDLNSELLSKKTELRMAIISIRELLIDESDQAIRIELEYQLILLENELNNLTQVNTLEITTSAFDHLMYLVSNLLKTIHDTVLNSLRNIR